MKNLTEEPLTKSLLRYCFILISKPRCSPAPGGPLQPRGPHAPRSPVPPGQSVPSPAPRPQAQGLVESVREDVGVSSDQRGDAGDSVADAFGAAQSEFTPLSEDDMLRDWVKGKQLVRVLFLHHRVHPGFSAGPQLSLKTGPSLMYPWQLCSWSRKEIYFAQHVEWKHGATPIPSRC